MKLQGSSFTVFCGSSDGASPVYREAADALGRGFAKRGARVVYGGASVGTMGALADGALAEGGEVVGVIPHTLRSREIAHHGLTELKVVESMHVRKALMSELADGYVTLPGGFGTWEECFEVITWRMIGMHTRPVVILNLGGFYDPILAMIERGMSEGFLRPFYRDYYRVAATVDEVFTALESWESPAAPLNRWSV
ncbi:MAG: TIGR00730 family Rossman fold protein [Polyangiales bacterium]